MTGPGAGSPHPAADTHQVVPTHARTPTPPHRVEPALICTLRADLEQIYESSSLVLSSIPGKEPRSPPPRPRTVIEMGGMG